MNYIFLAVLVTLLFQSVSFKTEATIKHGLRDSQNRHMIPRGFVANTNDHAGPVDFQPQDYLRMARMGANVQVIRLEMGRLSRFGNGSFEPAYMERLKRGTRLARERGIRTVFKLTVYGTGGFSWEALWRNKNNEQNIYIDAWRHVWEEFKDNDYVIGYDLVNEPRKLEMDISYDELTYNYLLPFYEKIIDAALPYSDDKHFLIQTIFMNKGEAVNGNQYHEIKQKINRKNIVFAPHIYQENLDQIAPTMQRFEKEAEILEAPILVGEWGYPTFVTTDNSVKEQLNYIEFYIKTAEVFDEMGIGAIKAWFLGNRSYQNFLPGGESTWSIFSDKQAVGTVERKYITDIIARPYPQLIAGDIQSFMFNFATRTLDLTILSDNKRGASRIFIAADRHYPDGFSVYVGDDVILSKNPLSLGFTVHRSSPNTDISNFVWDESSQQLIVLAWPTNNAQVTVKVSPGIYKSPDINAKNH